jgi:GR25 family glycosyltransferase involved in LPS biosynthesis
MENAILFLLLASIIFSIVWLCSMHVKKQDHTIGIFLINLDQRKDRLQITLPLLDQQGYYNIQRVEAVNGKTLTDHQIRSLVLESELQPIWNQQRTEHHQLSRGAVGCYLSHLKLWSQLQNDPRHDFYLILEDDTNPKLSYDLLKRQINKLPNDWDIYLCGGLYHRHNKISNKVCRVDNFMCTHAYVVRKKSVPILLKYAFPIKEQIDFYLSNLSREKKINIYGAISEEWNQNLQVNFSDIQTVMVEKK